jgi:uncharacterized metal-binding protein YceD (DUF177 family)
MKAVKNDRLSISFSGLKEGGHAFRFQVDETFMRDFVQDFEGENLTLVTDVQLLKSSSMLVLDFDMKGNANFPCDRCLDAVSTSITGTYKLYVKFGDNFDDTLEDVLILPHKEHKIDLSQYIYELAALSIPAKKVHKDGECNSAFIGRLNDKTEEKDTEETDPRWKALENLKQ